MIQLWDKNCLTTDPAPLPCAFHYQTWWHHDCPMTICGIKYVRFDSIYVFLSKLDGKVVYFTIKHCQTRFALTKYNEFYTRDQFVAICSIFFFYCPVCCQQALPHMTSSFSPALYILGPYKSTKLTNFPALRFTN